MIRKSSRGNPYHDWRGRFCSPGLASMKAEHTSEEYAQRSEERKANNGKYQKTPTNKIAYDPTAKSREDLIELGWVPYADGRDTVLRKDGYEIRPTSIPMIDEDTRVEGNKLYDRNGMLVRERPNGIAVTTPDGHQYICASFEDARRFAEADKSSHFSEIAQRCNCKIKQPISTSKVNGCTLVETTDENGGIIGHYNTKDYYIRNDDEDPKYKFNINIYSHATKSRVTSTDFGFGNTGRMKPMAKISRLFEHYIGQDSKYKKYESDKMFNGEKYTDAIIDKRNGKILHTYTNAEYALENKTITLADGTVLGQGVVGWGSKTSELHEIRDSFGNIIKNDNYITVHYEGNKATGYKEYYTDKYGNRIKK